MQFSKISGPAIYHSASNGDDQDHELPVTPGGRMVKRVQYMVKILQVSGTNLRMGLRFDHGPDARSKDTHSTPIPTTTDPGTDFPTVETGDVLDTTTMIGEWLMPCLVVGSSDANQTWMKAEVYEMRKPF